jgi:hypothetical protein
VKTTDDLLVVRSDAYELTSDGQMRPAFDGPGPVVSLDKDFYKLLPDFEQRFPAGAPSLRRCRRFDVEGDVTFGTGVTAVGDVRVAGPRHVPDGEVLGGWNRVKQACPDADPAGNYAPFLTFGAGHPQVLTAAQRGDDGR